MHHRELKAYKASFELAMNIFNISKGFPKVEIYSLTDQIRRSSRSVSANIAEAYRKRRYVKHFISKLSDADAENAETQVWLEFAHRCNYISEEMKVKLTEQSEMTGRLIGFMIKSPNRFISKNS